MLWRFRTWLQEIISRTNSGRSGQPPRSVASGLKAELFRGVRVQQIRPEHAIFNHDGAPGGNAFTVKRAGAKTASDGAVVDHVDAVACDLLSQLARQERCTAINGVSIHAFENMFEDRTGNHGIENHRDFRGLRFPRAQAT